MDRQKTGTDSNRDRSDKERERILLSAIFDNAPEAEPKPDLDKPEIIERYAYTDDVMLLAFHYEGRAYRMTIPNEIAFDFSEWLPTYAEKTKRCACCHEVIFPGQPITAGHVTKDGSDSGMSHFSDKCNDTAAGYIGCYGEDGEIIPFDQD